MATRSTQRAQTSLAEADHYSHIVHCKNVEPWLWKTTHPPKKKKRFWIITFTTIWVCYHYYGVFFAHLLILQYPDHHQNLISSYLYHSGPVHKISSQSVHNFLSNVVHRQTDRQTDRQTNATKNITSFAKEVITLQIDRKCLQWSYVYAIPSLHNVIVHSNAMSLKIISAGNHAGYAKCAAGHHAGYAKCAS